MSVLRSLFSGLGYLVAGLAPVFLATDANQRGRWHHLLVYRVAPVENIGVGVAALRINLLTGKLAQFYGPEKVMVLPGIHRLRRYPLYDQVYRTTRSAKATGEAPLQSIEGLSLGAEVTVRFAIEPDKLSRIARALPQDVNKELVEPLVEGTIYRIFSQHSVREIFSNKRQEIQERIENELKPVLAADGITLKAVLLGNIDLPKEYRAGLEKVLAKELKVEQMRYTLEINEKEIKQQELAAQARKIQTEVDAEANKIKRQKAAEDIGADIFDALGTLADRLAQRASIRRSQSNERLLAAHIEVASTYGVMFKGIEQDAHVNLCYDGEAFRRVLALSNSSPQQRARAALGLTRPECVSPELPIIERQSWDLWRSEVLDRVETEKLSGYLANRIKMRRAGVWAGVAFDLARQGKSSKEAGQRAIDVLASVNKTELSEEDATSYTEAAVRVGASRWAAGPVEAPAAPLF